MHKDTNWPEDRFRWHGFRISLQCMFSILTLNKPRPYLISQLRCLLLWNRDRSLLNALELAKSVLVLVDVMNALWPCSCKFHHPYIIHSNPLSYPTVQQHQCNELRDRLLEACNAVGLDPPLPPSYSLPPLLRTWLDFGSLVYLHVTCLLSFAFCFAVFWLSGRRSSVFVLCICIATTFHIQNISRPLFRGC